jgi:site-specific DNA-methyltransferase (adenine-specific)
MTEQVIETMERRAGLPKPYYEEPGITIYNADCRDILPLLPKVDLVLTDPPYGIGYSKYASHDDDAKEYAGEIIPRLMFCEAVLSDGWMCVFQAAKRSTKWAEWFPREWRLFALPKTFVQILPGAGPTWATDYALVWPVGIPRTQRGLGRDWFVCETSDMSKRPVGHPCPRPLNGIRHLVGILSNPTACILDPFMGSGTTLVAAKQLGRRAIGIEICEAYCQIAVERLRQAVLPLEPAAPEPEQMTMEQPA